MEDPKAQVAFVTPAERIRAIRDLLEPARFTAEGVSVEFETKPDFVAAVLPPGFEPLRDPVAVVRVANMHSAMCGDFSICVTALKARYREWEGQYCLSMVVSGDMPVAIGRDLWGEVKKRGLSALHVDGDWIDAYGSRDGERLVEIEAEMASDAGPTVVTSNALELKAWMSADGGLQSRPGVFVHKITSRFETLREGIGRLRLSSGRYDPLGAIPIVEIGVARHYVGELSYESEPVIELEDGDRYLPYIYGRAYDDLTLYPKPLRLRPGSERGQS